MNDTNGSPLPFSLDDEAVRQAADGFFAGGVVSPAGGGIFSEAEKATVIRQILEYFRLYHAWNGDDAQTMTEIGCRPGRFFFTFCQYEGEYRGYDYGDTAADVSWRALGFTREERGSWADLLRRADGPGWKRYADFPPASGRGKTPRTFQRRRRRASSWGKKSISGSRSA